jgi:hypothetical protein
MPHARRSSTEMGRLCDLRLFLAGAQWPAPMTPMGARPRKGDIAQLPTSEEAALASLRGEDAHSQAEGAP